MKTLTAGRFQEIVELEPGWASKLTEPVEITGYCLMRGAPITHLSPLLHFTGRNQQGECASFANCADLKVAEGTFHGKVYFTSSGIEKIGELNVIESDVDGMAAKFQDCDKLETAEGTYQGCVDFRHSGVKKIGKLKITKETKQGAIPAKADFTGCNIRLPAEFLGTDYHMDAHVRQANLARLASAKAQRNNPALEI